MLNVKPLSLRERRFFIYFFAAFFVFLLFPGSFYFPVGKGADGSEMLPVYLAIKNNLLFGRDFPGTYGPLAVLGIRFPLLAGRWVYLLGDLYFVFILFTGFRLILERYFRPAPILFLFCCVLINDHAGVERWYFILLLFFLLFFIQAPGRSVYLVHAAVLTVVSLYIKVDLGLLDVLILLGVLGYALLTKKIDWKRGMFFVFGFAAVLFMSAWVLHTDLPAYLAQGMQAMKDGDGAMYLPLSGRLGDVATWCSAMLVFIFVAAYVFALFTWVVKRPFSVHRDTMLVYGLVALGLFAWSKQAFVRADTHLFQFFEMVCPMVFLLYLYTPDKAGGKVIGIFLRVILTVDIFSLCLLPGHPLPAQLDEVVKFRLIPDKIAEVAHYFTGLDGYGSQRRRADSLRALPNMYKTAIGAHSVDMMPMDAALLYWMDLRYWPRAPDLVFFTLDERRDRLHWAEDERQKLALLARYQSRGFLGDQLVLERKALPRAMIKLEEDTMMVKLGEEIPVKRGAGLLVSRFVVSEDLPEKSRHFMYQPAALDMVYTLDDGDVLHFPASTTVLRNGFIGNKFVNSTSEFRLFMLSDGSISPDVRSIRIQAVEPGGYETAMKMVSTRYRFADKDAQQTKEDSLALFRLTAGNVPLQPLTAPPADDSDGSIRFDLDNFRDHGGLIRLTGWAIREKMDDPSNRVKVLVQRGKAIYALPTERSDVRGMPGELKSRADATGAGFSATLSRTRLPPGNYRVGLAVYDDRTGKGVVRYCDRYFDIEEEYRVQKTGRIMHSPEGDEIMYNIDDIDQRNGEVRIRGWAILPDVRARTATNLVLQSDTAAYQINTTLQRREDIMGAYKDSGFLLSGFTVTLPRNAGIKGVFRIGIEKVSPDGKVRGRILTGTTIKPGVSDNLMAIGTDHLQSPGRAYGNFDTMKDEDGFFTMGGWALPDTLRSAPSSIQIILKNEQHSFVTADVGQVSRPDVAGKYKNSGLLNCGFSARIAKRDLPKGRYQLGMYLHQQGAGGPVVFLFDKFVEIK